MEKGRISVGQVTVLIIFCTMGDMILIIPSICTHIAKQDAWISTLLSIPAGMALVWLLLRVHELYPSLTLIEAIRKILGKWLAPVVSIWYLFYFLMSDAIYIREFGDFYTTQTYVQTPLRILMLLAILMLVFAFFTGIEALARASELCFPFFVIVTITVVACLIPEIDFSKVKPIMENGVLPTIHGTLLGVSYPFGELVVFLMLFPYVKHSAHFKRSILLGSLIGGILLSLFVIMSLFVLGPFLTESSVYPSYMLTAKINVFNFFQRMEAFIAAIWGLSLFFKSFLYFYAFILGTAQTFRLKDYRPLSMPAAMLIYGLSMMVAPNIIYYFDTLVPFWVDWDLTNSVIIPLSLWGIYTIRQKRKQSK
ncbi:GerAB/ArcD/ProY family transporter [Paenibacillus terrae]|uniref:Spore gernimation protein n=1 Tax=Paenibacillus terrae TaxID=159743 RepID=A0A0D7X2J6_9BACL|nr:endospore germination permease [Paenibacillus terrae]KJD45611.1 spore gernimation protein [Paenibacillus terrae]